MVGVAVLEVSIFMPTTVLLFELDYQTKALPLVKVITANIHVTEWLDE
jgi:hypothetical protein